MKNRINLDEDLRSKLYPYPLHKLEITTAEKIGKMNFLDSQNPSDTALLCVHGNPTWSFYYRSLMDHFSQDLRVVIPDHLGMGLSSRFKNETFTLSDRVDHLVELLEHLNLKKIYLVVHDWGGPIGMLALKKWRSKKPAERIWLGVTFLNTAVMKARHLSKRISLCRNLLQPLVKHFGIFNYGLPIWGAHQRLSSLVKRGLLLPYKTSENRKSVADFIRDIPLSTEDKSYELIDALERFLPEVDVPVQILWGEKDFCFDTKYLTLMKQFFPNAEVFSWKDAGHLILEDIPLQVCAKLETFLSKHKIRIVP